MQFCKKIQNYLLINGPKRTEIGEEYEALHIKTKEIFAIKAFDKRKFEHFIHAVDILKDKKFDYLLNLEEFLQTEHHYYLVTEWVSSDRSVKELMRDPISRKECRFGRSHLFQILESIKQLNELDIDLKNLTTANVFVDDGGKLRIDAIASLNRPRSTGSYLGWGFAAAPERFLPKQFEKELKDPVAFTNRALLWNVGVVYYYMLFGHYPFNGNNEMEIYEDIKRKSSSSFIQYFTINISNECIEFLNACFQIDPVEPRSTEEFLNYRKKLLVNSHDPTNDSEHQYHNYESQYSQIGYFPKLKRIILKKPASIEADLANESLIQKPSSSKLELNPQQPPENTLMIEKEIELMIDLSRTMAMTKEFANISRYHCDAILKTFERKLNPSESSLRAKISVCFLLMLKKSRLLLKKANFQLIQLRQKKIAFNFHANYKIISSYISELKQLDTDLASETARNVGFLSKAANHETETTGIFWKILGNPLCQIETVNIESKRLLLCILKMRVTLKDKDFEKLAKKSICIFHELLYSQIAKITRETASRSFDWMELDRRLDDCLFRVSRYNDVYIEVF